MGHRLAILDDYQSVARSFADWEGLEGVDVTVFTEPFAGNDVDAVATLRDFDIIIAMRERTAFRRERLKQLPRLKLLVTTGMANDSIDLKAAAELGITVCGTSGSPTAAPELTWALLLAWARSVPLEDGRLRDGNWQSTVGVELSGKTLGVLGLGKIGRRIAGYGQAFGMEWRSSRGVPTSLRRQPPRPVPARSARRTCSGRRTSSRCMCASPNVPGASLVKRNSASWGRGASC